MVDDAQSRAALHMGGDFVSHASRGLDLLSVFFLAVSLSTTNGPDFGAKSCCAEEYSPLRKAKGG
jgi:hypothetical protein